MHRQSSSVSSFKFFTGTAGGRSAFCFRVRRRDHFLAWLANPCGRDARGPSLHAPDSSTRQYLVFAFKNHSRMQAAAGLVKHADRDQLAAFAAHSYLLLVGPGSVGLIAQANLHPVTHTARVLGT